jgi:hypothetical protein
MTGRAGGDTAPARPSPRPISASIERSARPWPHRLPRLPEELIEGIVELVDRAEGQPMHRDLLRRRERRSQLRVLGAAQQSMPTSSQWLFT